MFLNNKCSKENKRKYSEQVREYISRNGIKTVLILNYLKDDINILSNDIIEQVMGKDFPKAIWIDSESVIDQCLCFLKHTGYEVTYDESKGFVFKKEKQYKQIVNNYLKLSGSDIMTRLSECCEKTSGKITYDEMQKIIGVHYPRAPYAIKADYRVNIILFLKETGMLFKFDDNHIYIP